MPKHTKLRIEQTFGVTFEVLRDLLGDRAHVLAAAKGHHLGPWIHAKQKFGRGARLTFCMTCGGEAIVTPAGNTVAVGKQAQVSRTSPGMRGSTFTQRCPGAGPEFTLRGHSHPLDVDLLHPLY